MRFFGKHGALGRTIALLLAVGFHTIAPAHALPASPSLKPANAYASDHLSAQEFTRLRSALEAADEGRWSEVRSAIGRLSTPAARQLLRWRIATDSSANATFEELDAALTELADWPDRSRMSSLAEAAIDGSNLSNARKIAWLTEAGPRTGDGSIALAEAQRRAGNLDVAIRLVRDAWRTLPLTPKATRTVLASYEPQLTQNDHWLRVDLLLWRGDRSAAQELLPKLTSGRRSLADARIALAQNRRNIDAVVNGVPAEYANDPGLLLERAKWRERRRDDSGARELLDLIRGTDAASAGRDAIWREKHPVVRSLIREGDFARAYALSINHGIASGEGFRDAEWTAGWIALTRLSNPVLAEGHFRTFISGVDTPISTARGYYWLGESLKAQSRTAEAVTAYRSARQSNFTFYGQLAAERLAAMVGEPATLSFESISPPSADERLEFESRPEVLAAILLAETGRRGTFERFIIQLDDTLSRPSEHQMLFDIAQRFLEPRAALRSAKAGLQRGLVAPDAAYPVVSLPASPGSGSAEPGLVLALSRQESEFNPRAYSSAGARGLMQLMPRTAQEEARKVGVPFKLTWLTDDPDYNMRLGRNHLDGLVDRFDGSYLLAAAAYNAGASRVQQWIAEFGDPRRDVDAVEWVENIPFSETRNYVQRVLENLQVYRHRLSGAPTTIQTSKDLKRTR